MQNPFNLCFILSHKMPSYELSRTFISKSVHISFRIRKPNHHSPFWHAREYLLYIIAIPFIVIEIYRITTRNETQQCPKCPLAAYPHISTVSYDSQSLYQNSTLVHSKTLLWPNDCYRLCYGLFLCDYHDNQHAQNRKHRFPENLLDCSNIC